ncbi:MAG TPA: hypothetical protein VF669_11230 [Tepidisphaeraceae bacterium]|jgi:hypothetical protein
MIPAQLAISRLRRDLTLGLALNIVLCVLAAACLVLPMSIGGFGGIMLLTLVGVIWLGLSYQSVKGSRLAAGSPGLIAAGELEIAEHQIESALKSFSLYRTSKLMALHHLALLRHAQKRWEDCAQLCRELLQQRLGSLRPLERPTRLMLAEALLELNDLPAAHLAILQLYQQRLTLGEATNLLLVQLDYETRISSWEQMCQGLSAKAQLAELLPAGKSARAQAFLALAARKAGYEDWSQWLRRRAELLVDVNELTKGRPVLWELWAAPAAQAQVSQSGATTPATAADSAGSQADPAPFGR